MRTKSGKDSKHTVHTFTWIGNWANGVFGSWVTHVSLPIEQHPYFAKRTKAGKPYKRREAAMQKLKNMGCDSYIETRIVQHEE